MTAKDQPTEDRHAAIVAFYRAHPEMTLKQIGEHYGVTAGGVSQIISGQAWKAAPGTYRPFPKNNSPDQEFAAIRLIIAALEHLDEHARERVIQYARARLRDPPKDTRPTQRSENSGNTAANRREETAGAVDRQKD